MGVIIFIAWLAITYFVVKHVFRKNEKKRYVKKQDKLFWLELYPIDNGVIIDSNDRVKLNLSRYGMISYKDRFIKLPIDRTKIFTLKEEKDIDYNHCFIFTSFTLTENDEINLIRAVNTNVINVFVESLQLIIYKSKEIKIYIM